MNRLLFSSFDIVFQEVPNEVSLAINITGCPHRCEGCHSNYLWKRHGLDLEEMIDTFIKEYPTVTCFCFMGGDQNKEQLKEILALVRVHGFKTCLYTGSELEDVEDLIPYLDYLKTGKYEISKGGLDSESTNQKFYTIENKETKLSNFLFRRGGNG